MLPAAPPQVPTSRSAQGAAAPPAGGRAPSGLFEPAQLTRSFPDALRKLHPRVLVRNPVMFVVSVGAALTTLSSVLHPTVFTWVISVWLWLTVVFANLAEAVAEGRGKAQAASLRRARTDTVAMRLLDWRYGPIRVWHARNPSRPPLCGRSTSFWSGRARPSRPTAM